MTSSSAEIRRDSESDHFRTFLRNNVENDTNRMSGTDRRGDEFIRPIRVLLMNAYVFRPFCTGGLEPKEFLGRCLAAATSPPG